MTEKIEDNPLRESILLETIGIICVQYIEQACNKAEINLAINDVLNALSISMANFIAGAIDETEIDSFAHQVDNMLKSHLKHLFKMRSDPKNKGLLKKFFNENE